MEWVQTLSIIMTILGTGYYIHRDIRNDIKTQSDRTDKMYEIFTERTNAMSLRTDRLYEMFIDTLKEKNKP